ncbi:MAG: activator of (R)-2-hydroxyglutaryl-CoA dehydratase [Acidobacteria bacterium]|nr:activator of (R)-2-hydroxyglutaryl-CoA dehydratase [Acidobacteriota bacterium]
MSCTSGHGLSSAAHEPRTSSQSIPLRTREAIEAQIRRQVEAERARLEARAASQAPRQHFHRPIERPFTAAERDRVTILFGGLTSKHEWLIKSVFQAAGYKTEILPTPDVAAFQLGKEYGNNGQCNPTYFTVGHLIKYLQHLESTGLSRQEIIDNYVFFTAGSCGPCRFGMYEAEYRLAVQNSGFDGFRVLLFQQTDGIKAASGEPGLKFTVDFGMGAFSALNFGDVLNDITYQIRPFEVNGGETDRVMNEVMQELTGAVRERKVYEIEDHAPQWLLSRIRGRKKLRNTLNTLGKIHDHLYGPQTIETLASARERVGAIDVDRLRVKPVVKVTGEFWAQTTEGDGNFRMFNFLEREGAQVMVEPIGTWIMYMLWLAKANRIRRKDVDYPTPPWTQLKARLARELKFKSKLAYFGIGNWFYNHQYKRVVQQLGGIGHTLVNLDELAGLAAPYYNVFARGGEGHMEVAKNIYYTVHKKAHMVLSLKPFGCMPSSQSDGVQSAVMNHFKDMIFLPIETSGEGEINAHSRVQMALGEAKAKARTEFAQALASTGKSLDDIRRFVDAHPVLRRPFYHVPHRHGMTGTAAQFVLHVSDLMDGRARFSRVPAPAPRGRGTVSVSRAA